jgi:hypothetical protein
MYRLIDGTFASDDQRKCRLNVDDVQRNFGQALHSPLRRRRTLLPTLCPYSESITGQILLTGEVALTHTFQQHYMCVTISASCERVRIPREPVWHRTCALDDGP